MRVFFRSNTFKILFIVLVVMSSIIILSKNLGYYSVANVFGLIGTPMLETASELTDEQIEMFSSMSREELEEYCAQILEENTSLRGNLVSYYEIQNENELYEEALEIEKQEPELNLMPATIIARDPSDVFDGFTINIGYLDGIEVGDCVITSNGIIGVVSSTNAISASVSSIFSEDLSIGANSKEFTENGVVSGDAQASLSGYVLLEYLTKNTQITAGTIISTSGVSGNFPEGLIIGEVVSVQPSTDNSTYFAYVEPYEDIENVKSVFVVTSFTAEILVEDEDDE